jgi:hypothetical protein
MPGAKHFVINAVYMSFEATAIAEEKDDMARGEQDEEIKRRSPPCSC